MVVLNQGYLTSKTNKRVERLLQSTLVPPESSSLDPLDLEDHLAHPVQLVNLVSKALVVNPVTPVHLVPLVNVDSPEVPVLKAKTETKVYPETPVHPDLSDQVAPMETLVFLECPDPKDTVDSPEDLAKMVKLAVKERRDLVDPLAPLEELALQALVVPLVREVAMDHLVHPELVVTTAHLETLVHPAQLDHPDLLVSLVHLVPREIAVTLERAVL